MQNRETSMFENRDVVDCLEKLLQETEVVFQDIKIKFRALFVHELCNACDFMGREEPEFKTGYLMYHLLRTDLIRGEYRYHIVMYDSQWYFHKSVWAGTIDTGEIFRLYGVLMEMLQQRAKRYVGQVPPPLVDQVMLKLIKPFHLYIRELMLYSVAEGTETKSYRSLYREADFQIRVGEYMEPGDLIYREQEKKQPEELRAWLEENKESTYCFQDFKEMDFSRMELPVHDFRYTDFREAGLEGSILSFSRMTGARFQRSRMKGCILLGAVLHNADFTGADLEGADLSYSLSFEGKDPLDDGKLEGYTGSSFSDSRLKGARFCRAVLCGADFTRADLTGADFREAALFRCRFSSGQAEKAGLTAEQLEQIIAVG